MIAIAFSLGLFGSLHCVGMCGPIALLVGKDLENKTAHVSRSVQYNFGRIITYSILGLLFGVVGQFFHLVNLQKIIAVILGIILVISFFFSINIDHKINQSGIGQFLSKKVQLLLSKTVQNIAKQPPILIGLINGLLPCGLVYLALAGSLATESIPGSIFFMMFFGLGTMPIMLSLALGFHLLKPAWKSKFRKVLPYVTLLFGLFMIYRGMMVDMPEDLNFWEALKNPVMCF